MNSKEPWERFNRNKRHVQLVYANFNIIIFKKLSYISQLKVIEDPRSFWLKVLSERGDPIPLHHKLIDQFIINWMHVTGPVFSIPLAPCMIFYNSTPSMYLFLLGACSEKLHKNNVFQIIQMIHYTNLLTFASEI